MQRERCPPPPHTEMLWVRSSASRPSGVLESGLGVPGPGGKPPQTPEKLEGGGRTYRSGLEGPGGRLLWNS